MDDEFDNPYGEQYFMAHLNNLTNDKMLLSQRKLFKNNADK